MTGTYLSRRKAFIYLRIGLALMVAAIILFEGNPDPKAFARHIVHHASEQTGGGPDTFVVTVFPSVARAAVLANSRRQNYYLFSIYRVDYGQDNPRAYLGILWRFIPIGRESRKT